ncbi:glycoside hydrolase family 28 protein [Chryseolinea sp. T2]|uniref:glycoside hydrolase family 28 protein n=1 Tax=Chryseolinea sp. T2 TaxID=3129255 RepID=UPI0030789FCD
MKLNNVFGFGYECPALVMERGVRILLSFLLLAFAHHIKAQNAVFQQGTLPVIMNVSFKTDTFDIRKYGAKEDGLTLNTKPITDAIAACSRNGGGVVLVPKGLWITGPLVLSSNVNLYVAAGAVLQFSDNTDDYGLIRTNWEGLDAIRVQSPLYAADAENIAITGRGIIDGAGQHWRPVKKGKVTEAEWKQLVNSGGAVDDKQEVWYPTARALKGSLAKRPGVIAEGYDMAKAEEIKEFLRPNMVSIMRCRRVLLEGVTFQNSPAWCLHPLLTQHLTLRNLTVRNPWNAQNGDGVDVESCRYVLIENSTFDVGDDGICIKSGRDEEGRRRCIPTEDVIVKDCTVFHGHGGFVIGSEMSGGARNIFVSDCNFMGTDVGLRFKTARGRGGVVEKIYVQNIRMSSIGGAAILFDMYYMAKDPLTMFAGESKPVFEEHPVSDATPQFRDFHIKGVVCKGAETAIFIRGLPEMNIRDIHMEDISIQSKEGFKCIDGERISLKNATLYCSEGSIVDIQNGREIAMDKIGHGDADVLVRIEGAKSKDISVTNTNMSGIKKEFELGNGVPVNVTKR